MQQQVREREREVGRVLCTKFNIFIFIISMIITNLLKKKLIESNITIKRPVH